jgi:hypothetical protein
MTALHFLQRRRRTVRHRAQKSSVFETSAAHRGQFTGLAGLAVLLAFLSPEPRARPLMLQGARSGQHRGHPLDEMRHI